MLLSYTCGSSLWWIFVVMVVEASALSCLLAVSDLFVRLMVHYHNLLCTSLFEGCLTLPSWVELFSMASWSAINFANLEPFASSLLSPRGSIGRWSREGLCLEVKGGVNAHTEESCSSGLSRYSKGDRSCISARKIQKPLDIDFVPTKLSETNRFLNIKLQNLLRALWIKGYCFGSSYWEKLCPLLSKNGSIRNSRIKYLQQTWRWALKLHMECWSSNVEWLSLHHV